MITVEKLKAFGANTEEALARCFGNETLYLKLVATIPAEAKFETLRQALASNNLLLNQILAKKAELAAL